MTTVVLSRVAQILKEINANAKQAEAVFRRMEAIASKIHLARLAGDKKALRQAVQEAKAYNAQLRIMARHQRGLQQGPIKRGHQLPIAGSGGKPLPLPAQQQAGAKLGQNIAAQRAFAQALSASGKAGQNATKFLSQYGLSMSNLNSIMVDPISKVKQFGFKAVDPATGAVKRATFAVNRYGQVMSTTSGKVGGFSNMLGRNIMKVLEWSVAVGVVYGAFSKLSEAVDTLIEIDEVMSDLTVTTGEVGEALDRYFESAVSLSRESGIAVRDTISIYDDAIRSTSAITDETQQFVAANALLKGSLTLSRLAGMSANDAMDSLLGSLKQIGPTVGEGATESERMVSVFEQTEHVLDIWVYTSREARISVEDLANTFAITGAAAGAAGLDIEELTALTAVLAEKTIKSATEIGNSIRRMISTMQTETAGDALERLGISVEDLSGNMRDWDEIMGELASRRRTGAITGEAFKEITYALGGGARGGADVAAILESWDQVTTKADRLKDVSVVSGASEKAMAAKSETLTNAINDLSTAFTNLVYTLGGDGGLMDLAKGILVAFTGIINIVEGFVDILGPSTSRILIFGAALAALTKYGPMLKGVLGMGGGAQQAAGGLGDQAIQMGDIPAIQQRLQQGQQQPTRMQRAGQAVGQMAPAIMYAGAVAAMSEGSGAEKLGRAGAIMAGATISTLLGAGPAVGAVIGDVIGTSVIGVLEGISLEKIPVGELSEEELQSSYTKALSGLEATLAGSARKHFVDPTEMQDNIDKLVGMYKESGEEAAKEFAKSFTKGSILIDPVSGKMGANVVMQQVERVVEKEKELKSRGMGTGEEQEELRRVATEREKGLKRIIGEVEGHGIINQMIKERQGLLMDLAAGDITKKQFNDVAAAIDTVSTAGIVARETFEGFASIPIKDFFSHWIKMAPEARDEIMGIVTRINQLEDAIASATSEAEKSMLSQELKGAEEQAKVFWNLPAPVEQQKEDPFEFRGFTDFADLSEQEFSKVLAMAEDFQQQYLENLGIDEEIYKESLDAWVAYNADSFKDVEDLHQTFVQMAKKAFAETSKEEGKFNLQRLKDMDPGKIPELNQRTKFWENFLGKIPGYEGEEEAFNLVIGEEDVFHRMVTTQEALRFAIQDLTDVEKKQLEGMWNIPEGATVMVPLQSLYYAPKDGGEGMPELPPGSLMEDTLPGAGESLDLPADKMNLAGDKMLEAALQFQVVPYPEAPGKAEEAGTLMWEKAIQTQGVGGFGPISGEEMAQQIKPILKGAEDPKPPIKIEVPPIQADISVNTTVNLDGEKLAALTNRWRNQRMRAVSRGRGKAGGGVIQ